MIEPLEFAAIVLLSVELVEGITAECQLFRDVERILGSVGPAARAENLNREIESYNGRKKIKVKIENQTDEKK